MVGIVQHVYTQTVPDGTATSVVRPSDWNSAHNQTISLGGNTVGSAVVNGTNILLVGGNNITLSGDTLNSQILVSAGAVGGGTFSAGISNIGNTSGTSGVVSNRLVLAGGNNVTLSQSTNAAGATVTVSAGAGGAGTTFSAGVSTGGNTLGNTGTVSNQVVFAGGNNITLSQSTVAGGSATVTISGPNQSVQPVGTFGVSNIGNTVGTSSMVTNQLVLAGGNNITLSESTAAGGITITVSGANQSVQPVGTFGMSNLGNTVGTSSMVTNQIVFAGGNNITLSESTAAGGVTLTISGPNTVAQSVQTIGAYATNQTTGQASSTTFDARSFSVSGAGIVSAGMTTTGAGGPALIISATTSQSVQPVGTFGMSNLGNTSGTSSMVTNQIVFAGGNNITLSESTNAGGATLTISGPNTVAQSNQTLSIAATGNTTGNTSAFTYNATSLLVEGDGIASVGWSTVAGTTKLIVSVPAGGGGGDGFNIIEISGNTTGTSTTYLSATLALAGGNNITLSQSQSTITISAANQTVQPVGTFGMSNVGNTSGTSSMVTNQMVLAGGNNVTLSESTAAGGITLTISAANQTIQPVGTFGVSNIGNTAGTSSMVTNQMVLAGGNNITLSESTAAGGVTVTISGPNQSVQPVGTFGMSNIGNSAGTSSMVTNQIVFAGGNNITLSESTAAGGVTLTISGPNTVAQSVQTLGLYATNQTTGQASSTTFDARSLSVSGAGIISAGYSTTAAGAPVLIISATDASQSVQTIGAYAVGNTTTSTTSMTVDARSLSFDGAGIASVGMSGGSVVISVPAGGGAGFTAGMSNIGNTSGNSSMVNSTLVFAGGNNITLSEATAAGGAATITISAFNQSNQNLSLFAVGNTTGAASSTTANASNLSFDGAGAISVGMSNGSVIISDPGPISQWSFGPLGVFFIFNGSLSNGTLYLAPLEVPTQINLSVLSLFGSVIDYSPVSATTTTVSTTFSGSGQTTFHVALYSIGHGASSTALFTMSSISMTMSASGTGSESSRSYSVANSIGYPTGISNSTSFSTGSSTISTTLTVGGNGSQSNMLSNDSFFNGVKGMFFPCVTTLQPGEYAIGIRMLTTTAGNGGQPTGPQINFFQGGLATNAAVGPNAMNGYIGDTNQSAGAFGKGGGIYSVSFSTALQSKIAFTDLDQPPTVPFGHVKNFGT